MKLWLLVLALFQPPAADGAALYQAKCAICHDDRGFASAILGRGAEAGKGVLTNRRPLPAGYTREIIRQGKGAMPGFTPTEITDADAAAIAAWLER